MISNSRKELVELYREAIAAAAKVKRNADKLAFMSMSKANIYAFETYGEQLRTYEVESKAACDNFAKLASGMAADEIVSIIAEATQIGATA